MAAPSRDEPLRHRGGAVQGRVQNGAPVAFLATGEAFPDGLAASATAGTLGGPVLLARKTSLDSGTLAEFVRLNPATTYVAGGTSVVSDAEVASSRAPCRV